jgi:hypothetical protein
LRRIIITIGTAVAVLVAATVAFADANTYTAALSSTKAGSKSSPAPASFTQTLGASGTGGKLAAPLDNLKTTIYGLVPNPKPFPTCSDTQIIAAHNDTVCPKKALIATGTVAALLGSSALTPPGTACNPLLDVWNAGGGKLWFFFVVKPPSHTCATLTTGATPPYSGTIKASGKNEVINVPLPPNVSTNVAGIGLYGSLILEKLKYLNVTTKVKGKTVAFNSSVGCKSGKRPFAVAFTALEGGSNVTTTKTGSASCS